MIPGRDCIGVGVGAMVFNEEGEAFLAKRGSDAFNERGTWEFPGEKSPLAKPWRMRLCANFKEEYGMDIELLELLGVNNHILLQEREHWVSPTFIAHPCATSTPPTILEPTKCSEIGWFALSALPTPLSQVTQEDVRMYQAKHAEKRGL